MTDTVKGIFIKNSISPNREELDAKSMAIAGETTRKFFTEGPPVKNWTLGFNITVNLRKSASGPLMPRSQMMTPKTLDYDQLIKDIAPLRVGDADISARGGNHGRHTYLVDKEELLISPHKYFDELVAKDKQACENNSPRSLFTEIVAHDSLLENAIKNGHTKEQVLDIHPLSEDEVVMVYFHGGAYVYSSPTVYMGGAADLSKEAGYRAFLPNYRLAPENPFPAPVHDGYIFFQYLLSLGYKAENIIVMGCSAGGNLCMNIMQLQKLNNAPQPRGAALYAPWCDLNYSTEAYQKNSVYDFLPPASIEDAINISRLYVGPGKELDEDFKKLLNDPLVSPVYADMDGWAPMYIQSGEIEMLVDDIDDLARRAGAKQNLITGIDHPGFDTDDKNLYDKFAGMVHAFNLFDEANEKHAAVKGFGHFARRLAQKH
ncbi:hypothetical protein BB558_000674 [Smittium angustum]|uniref:Alpha/beta hydrolase fold-3 domain-containing protein n=1 Tax=Smittium angustum TaxID=133377 RepID=A0A2U1JDH3_SMIAN|nr:hypothetical protein BB558_000674 [Smittium angustum]